VLAGNQEDVNSSIALGRNQANDVLIAEDDRGRFFTANHAAEETILLVIVLAHGPMISHVGAC